MFLKRYCSKKTVENSRTWRPPKTSWDERCSLRVVKSNRRHCWGN